MKSFLLAFALITMIGCTKHASPDDSPIAIGLFVWEAGPPTLQERYFWGTIVRPLKSPGEVPVPEELQ